MDDILQAIDELSRTTDRIEELNPNALEEMGDALTARSRVMIRIHQAVAAGEAEASPQALNRLSKELERGSEIIRRLKLVQARLRDEYSHGRQRRNMLRGIHSNASIRTNSSLDFQG